MRTHVYAGEQLARYGFPGGHPFSPHRFGAFYREFISRGLNQRTTVCAPHDGPAEILQPFHTQSYVGLVRDFSQRGYGLLDRGDTPAFPGCFEAALTVCATVLAAVEDIMQGKAEA
ncbi:MAG: hypothetical protein N2Z22_07565, partial [Turneriella sp.]|nr:hypothetical protein [Turneriella sp.]